MSQTLPETITITIRDLEVRRSSSGKYAGKEYIIITDEGGKRFMVSLFDEDLVKYAKTLRPGDIIEASVKQDSVIPRIQSIRIVGFDSEVAGSREKEPSRTEMTNRREALRLAVAVTEGIDPLDERLGLIARCFDVFLEVLRTGYSKSLPSLAEELKKRREEEERKFEAEIKRFEEEAKTLPPPLGEVIDQGQEVSGDEDQV